MARLLVFKEILFIIGFFQILTLTKTLKFTNLSSSSVVNRNYENSDNSNDNKRDFVIFDKLDAIVEEQNDSKNFTVKNLFDNDDDEQPIRFDGDQLFRLNNIKQKPNFSEIIKYLENNHNINLWNENGHDFIDFSVPKASLDSVKTYLKEQNLTYGILINNIQESIDNETRSLHRLKRSVLTSHKLQEYAGKSNDGEGFMSWNRYHGLKDIYGFLRFYNRTKPKLCTLYNIGKSVENRTLIVLKVSNGNPNNKAVWIDGGIHAREWISPASVTYILYHLIENWNSLPLYIKNIDWYFMPMVNPDGYEYSRRTNRLWRKNKRKYPRIFCEGVDLNRNFGFQWDAEGSSSTENCAETYRGARAFSEPESQAIANFLTRIRDNLTTYLTIHSYGQYILYPWAYIAQPVSDYKKMHNAGLECAKSAQEIAGTTYKVAPAHILGIAGGGSDDWAKATFNLDYVYTIELRDRGQHGFLLPVEQIYETCREALRIVKTLAKFIT